MELKILPGVNTGTTKQRLSLSTGPCPAATAIPMARSTMWATTATGGHRHLTMLPMPGTGTWTTITPRWTGTTTISRTAFQYVASRTEYPPKGGLLKPGGNVFSAGFFNAFDWIFTKYSKPIRYNISVLCTFENYVGKFILQIFHGAAAGAAHRNICSNDSPIGLGRCSAPQYSLFTKNTIQHSNKRFDINKMRSA